MPDNTCLLSSFETYDAESRATSVNQGSRGWWRNGAALCTVLCCVTFLYNSVPSHHTVNLFRPLTSTTRSFTNANAPTPAVASSGPANKLVHPSVVDPQHAAGLTPQMQAFINHMASEPLRWATALRSAITIEDVEDTAEEVVSVAEMSHKKPVHVVVVVPAGVESPLHGARLEGMSQPSLEEVMLRMAQRVAWVDPEIHVSVFTDDRIQSVNFETELRRADICVAAGVQDVAFASQLKEQTSSLKNVIALDCVEPMQTHLSPRSTSADLLGQIINFFRPSKEATLRKSLDRFWGGRNSEDLLNLFLVLVQNTVRDVDAVKYVVEASSFSAVSCMVSKCRNQIIGCFSDDTCKAGLECLDNCDRRDQVCSYRCIASYESPAMEAFSLCIMQKHNCFGCHSAIPTTPDPQPLSIFRGQPVTHELAEEILIGHGNVAGTGGASWKVVMGMNPAYDAFPCQNQVFYRGRGQVMWYDPVFQVPLKDGTKLWRRRHYRVARREAPGTFRFSVLDNGITTVEHWRILEASEDLSWALLFYQGAASAAGQSYIGALLLTPDGALPKDSAIQRDISAAFTKHDLRLWEMQTVDNRHCEDSPL